jgi:RNA polymerase sigma-32 factor
MADLPVIQDSLRAYLVRIRQIPLLTAEEEFQLAVKYREDNDMESAHKLITSNLRFVVKVALEYKAYGLKPADLIQEGNIGLMMALKKFNPYKGYRFISYAVWWIRAYIQNFIIQNWSLVKIGTTQAKKKIFYKIGTVRKALESAEKDKMTYDALARDLDVREKDIIEMEQRMSSRDLSLNTTLGEDDELTRLDLLREDGLNQEERFSLGEERKIREQLIREGIKNLNEKEKYIIAHRVMAESPLTLKQIGNHLKLSRERVRQIEGEALQKLKQYFRSSEPLGL